ncbi:MAG: cell wall metabolism sensor histidine kinase WalK, partial [Thermoflexales bacterium]|nr:cell wall metabolism sensor histidine kinase WalK [Thermoflexales bacterium]
MDALTISVIAISFLVVIILLVRLRRTLNEVTRLASAVHRTRQQLDATAAELKQCRAAHDALVETVFDPVIFLDDRRRIVSCNHAAHRLGIGKVGHSLIEATRSYELDSLAEDAIAGRAELPREFALYGRLFRAQATRFEGGVVLVMRDVSELQRLGRARRDFVANISHELRTPLASLKALVETLHNGALDDPPAARRFLKQMEDEIDALTQMVQELLELSRLESGLAPLELEPVAVTEIVIPPVERLRPQAERAGLSLTVELASDLPPVLADLDRARQVVTNLVHNAIKFTPEGGQIIVTAAMERETTATATAQPAFVLISVKDTGVGIAPEDLPRIF